MQVLISVLVIMWIIMFHEFGHFCMARILGVQVYGFAVGMGPKLLSHKDKHGVEWSLRLLPIGGFCMFDDPEQIKRQRLEGKGSAFDGVLDVALDRVVPWKRILIYVGGPLFNILLALLISVSMYTYVGEQTFLPYVDSVIDGMPAQEAGMQDGDCMLLVNGEPLDDGDRLAEVISDCDGQMLNFLVQRKVTPDPETPNRDIELLNVEVTPYLDEGSGLWKIGIYQKVEHTRLHPWNYVKSALEDVSFYVFGIYQGLWTLLTSGQGAEDVVGVVGVVDMVSEYAKPETWVVFVTFASFLSANLGVMNLLPIPALDGSRVISACWEWITKKKPNQKIMIRVTAIGFALVLALVTFLCVRDIGRIIMR